MTKEDPVVGHITFGKPGSFRHEPLRKSEADRVFALVEEQQAKRTAAMPDEAAAIRQLFEAHTRLCELGWRPAIYCPKDGSWFEVIEAGSTGIHRCQYTGEWPDGSWWIEGDGDLYPSRPILWRPIKTEEPR